MVKVTRPLFSDAARGNLGNIGSYRMGRNGPEFIKRGGGGGTQPPAQEALKAKFAEAKAAHSASPMKWRNRGKRAVYAHVTPWPEFWLQWMIEHP